MVLPGRAGHRRHSFVDARNDGRQMEVTWHEEASVVVISLWQGGTCRSTFRMPIEDAPALIGILSSALGDAVSFSRSRGPEHRFATRSSLLDASQALGLLHRLLRRRRADVVPLRPLQRESGSSPSVL